MTTTAIAFEPLTITIGAQVPGIDLAELTPEVVAGIRAAHPEIYVLDSGDGGKAPVWHTDVTFTNTPPLGSVLRAVDLPPAGGDTCWTDLEAAYLTLSPPLRRLADQLEAVHDGRKDFEEYLNVRLSGEGNVWEGERVRSLDPVVHPVVRVHPETGRRSLFVNPASPHGSRTCPRPKAVRCWASSSPPSVAQSTACATGGAPATSWCGTTAARRTTLSTTTETSTG